MNFKIQQNLPQETLKVKQKNKLKPKNFDKNSEGVSFCAPGISTLLKANLVMFSLLKTAGKRQVLQ